MMKTAGVSGGPRISLVVPLYNEEPNVRALLDDVAEALVGRCAFELILVDDGSTDRTCEEVRAWVDRCSVGWVRLLRMRRNVGQSAAILAGARQSRGEYVAAMDGDMQNDPRDLIQMEQMLDADPGLGGVVGVRASRQDTLVRRLSSKIGNGFRNVVTGDRVTDSGCGIKMFRRQVFLQVPRFNGMHRFMASLARYVGAEVRETRVHHRARHAGEAKYGVANRLWRGILDCLAMRWMRRRAIPLVGADELSVDQA